MIDHIKCRVVEVKFKPLEKMLECAHPSTPQKSNANVHYTVTLGNFMSETLGREFFLG